MRTRVFEPVSFVAGTFFVATSGGFFLSGADIPDGPLRWTAALILLFLGLLLLLIAKLPSSGSAGVRRSFRQFVLGVNQGGTAWDPPRSIGFGDSGGAGRGRELGDLPGEAFGRDHG